MVGIAWVSAGVRKEERGEGGVEGESWVLKGFLIFVFF